MNEGRKEEFVNQRGIDGSWFAVVVGGGTRVDGFANRSVGAEEKRRVV